MTASTGGPLARGSPLAAWAPGPPGAYCRTEQNMRFVPLLAQSHKTNILYNAVQVPA